jgi:hypothetical protein
MIDELFGVVFACVVIILIVSFSLGLYFLPTLIALSMHHHHVLPIFLLNFFTGWSGIGWIGSLIWSVIV